jgi:hypothetical protein
MRIGGSPWNCTPPSYIYHLPSSSEVMDLARVKEVDAMFHAAFPDLHFTLVDMVAFSILIHSRTDTRGFANAKFEPEFKPEGHFHYVSTDQLCLALAKST